MSSLFPQTPGDRREDYAQDVAATLAAAYAQTEAAIITTIAAFSRRIAADTMATPVARRRLSDTVDAAFTAVARRARFTLDQVGLPQETATQLATTLDAAADTASRAALDALDRVVAATEAAKSPHLQAVDRAINSTRGGLPGSSLSLSRIQAAQKALDDLAAQGITGYIDRTGRCWNLTSYVEMATRTAVSNAWDGLQAAAAARSGFDLVLVATHSTEGSCPHCLPWLGRTLTLTGATAGYPSLDQAKAAGFRHPNCRCYWTPLGAGIAPEVTNPVTADRASAAYRASQRQRALERRVREAHRRTAAAITPAARATARRDLATARAGSAEHRQRTGLVMTQAGVRRREHGHRAH